MSIFLSSNVNSGDRVWFAHQGPGTQLVLNECLWNKQILNCDPKGKSAGPGVWAPFCKAPWEGNRLRERGGASPGRIAACCALSQSTAVLPLPCTKTTAQSGEGSCRVASPWPPLVQMRTLRPRKGKDPNRDHIAGEGLEPLMSCFLVRGRFPWATWPCHPSNP